MRAFLGINYLISINKLPTIKSCWNVYSSLVTRALETLCLGQDLKTLFRISIFRATQKMTKVTKVAKSDPLSTILTRVLVILLQMMILKALTGIWWNSKVDQAWKNIPKTNQSSGESRFGITVLVKEDTSISLNCTWVKKKTQKKIWDQVMCWKRLNPFKIVCVLFFW